MYSSLLEKIIMPLGDLLNRSSYIHQLNYWRKVDTLSEKEIQNLQESNLKKLLKHSIKNIDYYEKYSLKESNIYKSIASFPILTKDILRDNSDSLISNIVDKSKLIPYSSSGSSGVQTTVFMSKKEQSIIRGILTHWWEWSGYKIGRPLVLTGITPDRGFVKRIKDFLFNTIYINAFYHTENQLLRLCKKMQQKDYFLAGYASSLNVIAEFAKQNNFKINVKGTISLGDKLFDSYKKNIETVFNTVVKDTYGSNEGFMIAAQDDLPYYYILSPHVYVEILDDHDNPVPDGELGNIVVTRLDAYSMPLIRYKLGDLGIMLPKSEYPKNRKYKYPLLKKVIGRETDIVYLPDNSKMVVHSFTGIFEYISEIKQFKVIQKDKRGIFIEFIKSKDFNDKALTKAKFELRKYISDENFYIKFLEVDYIAPSKSGKPQIIESNIK